jgi:hypothetical protein
MFPVVDVSDTTMAASGTTKRISINNILACSPSATLASLNVTGSSMPANGLYLPTTNTLEFAANSLAQYRIAPLGVFSWYDGAGGTRMTLNSTGLGVGAGPGLTGGSRRALTVNAPTGQLSILELAVNSVTTGYLFSNASQTSLVSQGATFLTFDINSNERMRIDSAGNVGVGVTPNSAWNVGSGKTIQLTANASLSGGLTNSTYLAQNWYYDNVNSRYLAAGYALVYEQNKSNGSHVWYNTTLGAAAGDVATIIPAMTLDINGNLILRSSSTPATLTVNNQLTVNATSNTNLRFSYRGSDGTTRVANITLA